MWRFFSYFDKNVQNVFFKERVTTSREMGKFGEKIRELREERAQPLRTVAAFLDIDQAILSKIERGLRKANREQVVKMAEFFDLAENELLVPWLSDKLIYEVADEDLALEAIQVAEATIAYKKKPIADLQTIISTLRSALADDGRIAAAWLYGSTAKREDRGDSDLDLIIEFNQLRQYSMFDLLDIAYVMESKVHRKVDLVEKGQLKDFALKTSSDSLIQIYG